MGSLGLTSNNMLVSTRVAATAPASANVLDGTLVRASYLGETVDYQVQLEASDVVLRVTGPTPAPQAAAAPPLPPATAQPQAELVPRPPMPLR